MATYENVIEMVTEFITERKKTDGGFAPVGEDDVKVLSEILKSLIKLKYEEDPDGDMPIEFQIVDRNKYGSLMYEPIPYDSWILRDKFGMLDEDPEEIERLKNLHDLGILRILHFQASMANNKLDNAMRRIMQDMEYDLKKKD